MEARPSTITAAVPADAPAPTPTDAFGPHSAQSLALEPLVEVRDEGGSGALECRDCAKVHSLMQSRISTDADIVYGGAVPAGAVVTLRWSFALK